MSDPRAEVQLPMSVMAGTLTRGRVVMIAGVAIALPWIAAGYLIQPSQAAFSYLVAVLFLVSLAVGALFWVLVHHLTAAVWSVVLRRLTEHLTSLLIPAAVLFVPVLVGLGLLFPWLGPEGELDATVASKGAYLNAPFFIVRAVVYFAVWLSLAGFVLYASRQQDEGRVHDSLGRVRQLSGLGILLLAITTTFAAFDWIMSLDPHWYSNIIGVYFWSGAILASLAALTLLVLGARRYFGLQDVITVEHLHDLGKLLFGFTVFWTYIAFSQYFLIWYAAIPEETTWYARRLQGSWGWVGIFLVWGHFGVPFAALLPRAPKRSPLVLGLVSLWLLVCHAVDVYWQVMPTYQPDDAALHWIDLGTWLLVIAVSGLAIIQVARNRPLIPVRDPDLFASIHLENE